MAAARGFSFIGLSGTGGPLVSRLLDVGHQVTVADLNRRSLRLLSLSALLSFGLYLPLWS